ERRVEPRKLPDQLQTPSRCRDGFDFQPFNGCRAGADEKDTGLDERLHLQVLVVAVERRRVHADAAASHRPLESTLVGPDKLGSICKSGAVGGGIESTALESTRRRQIDERIRRGLHLDTHLWCPGVETCRVVEVVKGG